MLFDRPLASFTNNIIYIDCPNNCKTRLEVVCTILCFLKITSFHTPHNNFKTLPPPSKLQRESCLKYSIRCYFTASFLSRFWSENRRRRIPAVCRMKPKFTEHAQQNAPLLSLCFPLLYSRRCCLKAITCSWELSAISSRSYPNYWTCFVVTFIKYASKVLIELNERGYAGNLVLTTELKT